MDAAKEVEEVDKNAVVLVGPSEEFLIVSKVEGQNEVVQSVVVGEVEGENEVPMRFLLTTTIVTSVNGATAHITTLRDREVDSNHIITNSNHIMKNNSIMCSASHQIFLPICQDYKSMSNLERIIIFLALLNSKEDGENFPKEAGHCNTLISLNLRQPRVEKARLLLNGVLVLDTLMPLRNKCNTDEEEVVVEVLEVQQAEDNSGILRLSNNNNINHLISHKYHGARVPRDLLNIGRMESFTRSR